jgi:hypothetical protein
MVFPFSHSPGHIEGLRDFMLSAGRKRGDKRGPGLSARSVRLTLGRLSAAFDQAVDDGWPSPRGPSTPTPRSPAGRTSTPDTT